MSWATILIFIQGDLSPVRLDQLSAEQEQALENGKKYRFVDIEDSSYMKQKVVERGKEEKEKKEMIENDKKENEGDSTQV